MLGRILPWGTAVMIRLWKSGKLAKVVKNMVSYFCIFNSVCKQDGTEWIVRKARNFEFQFIMIITTLYIY